jgi:geranylgeranyl pyrophosphate synthase
LHAGPLFQNMFSTDEHAENVHQIIQDTLAFEQRLPFPEFSDLLGIVLSERRPSAGSLPWLLLPIFTCEALGGSVRRAQQVAAALEIGRIAAGCLDEWQDQDTDDALWRSLGAPRTITVATGLISLAFLTLGSLVDLGAEPSLVLSLHEEFHRTLLDMSAGQDADLSEELSLDDYEQVAGAKSGSLFRLGCRAGAMVAGAPPQVVARYGDFGYNLGVVGQMWNDLQGLAGMQGKGDLEQKRSLPILAMQAAEGMQPDPSLEEGQVGPLYALVRLQVFHQRAVEALNQCPEAGRLPLFLDAFGTHRLVQRAERAFTHREEGNAL